MKLAEALAERKALDARLSSIEGRLRANARIQEGDAVRIPKGSSRSSTQPPRSSAP